MKKKFALLLVPVLLLLFAGNWMLMNRGFSVNTGRCLIAGNGSVLLMLEDHGPICMSDHSLAGNLFEGLSDGDRVLVLHDGIAESYPSQTAAYFLLRLGSGSRADMEPQHLQELAELGWITLDSNTSSTPNTPALPAEPDSYAFDAQYIRTNGYHDNADFPRTVVIRSRAELEAYYEANRELYDLERKDKVYSDTTIGFLDACDKYDDAYFAERDVLFILLEEGSGSIRHKVTDVRYDGTEWVVSIRRITPEEGTADMAEWHIMVEVQMGKVFDENTPIRVEFVK